MESSDNSPKDYFKNAICYIPFLAIVLYFIDDIKSEEYKKNIKYGVYLFVLYVFITVLIYFFLYYGAVLFILFLVYLIFSFYYGIKAYRGEDVNIFVIDELDKKVNGLGK
ncbi:hypothetical protein EOM39_01050 [Candidatus Gracilibacteria bacterium]|nr:hypothetical protein [Candidatus Gracilibacteria bacterium]